MDILITKGTSFITSLYRKPTFSGVYLNFKSHHPQHIKENIPFNLAKRIIVFVSNEEKEKVRLEELKLWLLNCQYPLKVISKGIHNAKLQGPAPSLSHKPKIIPLVTTFYNNLELTRTIKFVNNRLNNTANTRLKEVFGNTKTILALRQPPNLLRHLTKAEYNRSNPRKENGIFRCSNQRCKLCKLYLQPVKSFSTANGYEWIIRSHITCNSFNVCYYLECVSCDGQVTYTGKTNIIRKRLNVHISSCRTGNTSNTFDLHVFKCGKNPKCEPYFCVYAFVALSDPKYLLTYESYLHRQKFDTLN